MIPEIQQQNGGESGEVSSVSMEKEATLMLITVIGAGQARVVPDQAVVLAIVVGNGVSASQALHETAGRLAQVAQAVLARGLPNSEVQVTWANVVPSSPSGYQAPGTSGGYSPPGNGQGQLPGGPGSVTGFIASYGLQIVLPDPNRLGEIIDITLGAGASFSSGGLLRLRDETLARSLALEAACQAANVKATRLATGLGRPLGGVVSLVEEAVDLGSSAAGTGSATVGSGSGELIFYSRVRITYELR